MDKMFLFLGHNILSQGQNILSTQKDGAEVIKMTNVILGKWKPRAEYGECGYNKDDELTDIRRRKRASGGKKSLPEDHPHLALLVFSDPVKNNTVSYKCVGSLINQWHILTSAQCVYLSHEPLR